MHDQDDERGLWAGRALAYVVLALVALGIVVLASASTFRSQTVYGDPFFFFKRQLIWLGLGALALFFCARFNYHYWRKLAKYLAIFSTGLLILVLFSPKINGSHRWLHLGVMHFQPSELAKLAVVILLAHWIARGPWRMAAFKDGVLIPGLALGMVLVLVLLEPDFGTTIMLAGVGWTMLFIGGTSKKWLLPVAAVGLALLLLFLRLDPIRWERILAWLWPKLHPKTAYQMMEAINAFILGGLDINWAGSIKKQGHLPEAHTDFIFAIAGEELGLLGSLGIVGLFAAFLVCGLMICLHAPDLFGRYLAFGITLLICFQAILNMYVVTGLLPTKGITLPFFSYGGSSLFMTLTCCGILLNIGRYAENRRWYPLRERNAEGKSRK